MILYKKLIICFVLNIEKSKIDKKKEDAEIKKNWELIFSLNLNTKTKIIELDFLTFFLWEFFFNHNFFQIPFIFYIDIFLENYAKIIYIYWYNCLIIL